MIKTKTAAHTLNNLHIENEGNVRHIRMEFGSD
jgi:hypothetical protein